MTPCRLYKPDHNGECLYCDEPMAAHSADAIAIALVQAADEIPELYDVARRVNHEAGYDWTDPRTGITYPAPAHFTCPHCGAVSFNPNDLRERYCGRCHRFVDDPADV